MNKDKLELSIIIVNYKTPLLTTFCIQSVINTIKEIKYEIIVVDNNSNDDSEKKIKSKYPEIIWVQNKINEGFGRANNKGIDVSKGKYLLFLNSDVQVCEKTIDTCLNFCEENKNIGVLGCTILNEDNSLQKSVYFDAASFKSMIVNNLLINYFGGYKNKKINAIMGSFMLVPKTVIEKVGSFDPDFFLYSEEIELCMRISKAGFKIEYFKEATAYHKHEGSQTNKKMNLRQRYLSNALLYYKIHGLLGYSIYHLTFIINTILNFILMWFINSSYRKDYHKEYYETTYGYISNMFLYLTIPIFYKRRMGNGKRMLRCK